MKHLLTLLLIATAPLTHADESAELANDSAVHTPSLFVFPDGIGSIENYIRSDYLYIPHYQERPHPYLPDPSLTLALGGRIGTGYSDNVFRAPSNTESDLFSVVQPTADLRFERDRLQLSYQQAFDIGFYTNETDNDYTDSDSQLALSYRFSPTLNGHLNARYRYDHIAIGASDEAEQFATAPTTYRYSTLETVLKDTIKGDEFASLGLRYEQVNYDNVSRRDGSRFVNDDRDHSAITLFTEAGFHLTPHWVPYASLAFQQISYDVQVDTTAVNARDSDGLEGLLGVRYRSRRDPVWFDLASGMVSRSFDDRFYGDVNSIGLHAEGGWRASEALYLTSRIQRQIRETAITDASSYIHTSAQLESRYQLAPKWELSGSVRYDEYDFQINNANGAADRIDDLFRVGGDLKYALMEHYFVGFGYAFAQRESDNVLADYDENRAQLYLEADF